MTLDERIIDYLQTMFVCCIDIEKYNLWIHPLSRKQLRGGVYSGTPSKYASNQYYITSFGDLDVFTEDLIPEGCFLVLPKSENLKSLKLNKLLKQKEEIEKQIKELEA